MDIGKRLYELRTAKGFSQGDIEHRTGLLGCYVSRVENGHTVPKLDTLAKYAKALEVELYQLFYAGQAKPEAPQLAERQTPRGEERALLKAFRGLAKPRRRLALDIVRNIAATEGQKSAVKPEERPPASQ